MKKSYDSDSIHEALAELSGQYWEVEPEGPGCLGYVGGFPVREVSLAEAIDEGQVMDVSREARQCGIADAATISVEAWAKYVLCPPRAKKTFTEYGRVKRLLRAANQVAERGFRKCFELTLPTPSPDSESARFWVEFGEEEGSHVLAVTLAL